MLTAIRKKSKGWVAYLIVGILIIPFSLFGIQQYLAPSANTSIASVDGEDIDMNMYYQELDVTQRYYQQRLAADYTQEFDDAIKQNILEKIINMKLLENFANSINIVTTDEEVRKVIRADKTFQIDGEFSNEQYIRNLRLMRYTLESYETFQSKILSYNQILKNLSESSFWSDIQIEQINNLFSQQREVSYIALTTEKYEDQISVSQSDISDYFNANNSNFLEGPKVKVDFVELSLENIDEPEDADNETLQSLYDENSELYTNPERRRAQHILVEGEDLAKDLLEQIKQGADFVELANTNSIDTSSNEQGGDLGLFEIEHMVPEFGKVVFEMNVGNISEVVKTDYGYHIIKLNEIQQSTLQSFEEVREQLVALYKNEAKQKILFDLEEEFANLAYEESLDMLADQLDLEIQTSDFFSSGELPTSLGTIELSNSNATTILSAAFSEGVIEEGENSDVIELDQNNFVVLSLSSLQPERQKELNEVEAQIIATLKTLGAKKLIDNLSLSIVSALTSGDELTVNKLLTDNELEWNDEGWISRTTQLPFDITNIAYTIPKPILGEHTYSSKSVDNSTSLVIDLKAVRLPEGENDTGISELYLSQENNEMFVSLIKQLRESAEIKVFSDLL
jgi:peptidyl-prolyl cis-trans isomerase D